MVSIPVHLVNLSHHSSQQCCRALFQTHTPRKPKFFLAGQARQDVVFFFLTLYFRRVWCFVADVGDLVLHGWSLQVHYMVETATTKILIIYLSSCLAAWPFQVFILRCQNSVMYQIEASILLYILVKIVVG